MRNLLIETEEIIYLHHEKSTKLCRGFLGFVYRLLQQVKIIHVIVVLYEIVALFTREYSFASVFGKSVAAVGLWVVTE